MLTLKIAYVLVAYVVCLSEGRSRYVQELGFDDVKYTDCDEVRKIGGYTESGVYTIWLDQDEPMEVHCQFEGDVSYISIMSQKFGHTSFQRHWYDYEVGFGYPASGDFWQGLKAIYTLNKNGYYYMNITLQDWTYRVATVGYSFHLLGPADGYKAYFNGYYSPDRVPDDLSHNSGAMFATVDKPDPNGCALQMLAGWWYNYCTFALPTGKHYPEPIYKPSGKYCDGLFYQGWNGYECNYSLWYIRIDLAK